MKNIKQLFKIVHNSHIMLLVFVLILLIIQHTSLYAENGDVFTAKTVEGVNMTFKIVSEADKTCQVGIGQSYTDIAIEKNYYGDITIPTIANGYKVVSIADYAFYCCNGLTGLLTIPNTVTSIGSSAFQDCSGFTGLLMIPNSVTYIGGGAFARCSGLTGSLTIPNSVTYIGESAFEYCTGFSGSLTISNSVTSIEYNTFYGCSGLTGSLTIPNSVKSIGSSAFLFCSELTGSLTIPNSVTHIGEFAFAHCKGLTGSLTIPNSVISIESHAFYNCNGITFVKSEIKEPFVIENTVFEHISVGGTEYTLQVPKGSKSKYMALTGWTANFTEIVEEEESTETFYTLSITVLENGSATYITEVSHPLTGDKDIAN